MYWTCCYSFISCLLLILNCTTVRFYFILFQNGTPLRKTCYSRYSLRDPRVADVVEQGTAG